VKLFQKRALAWVIAALMVFTMIPTAITFAEEYTPEYEPQDKAEEYIEYEYLEAEENDEYEYPLAFAPLNFEAFSANLPAAPATVNLAGIPSEEIVFNTAAGGTAAIAVGTMVTSSSTAGGYLVSADGFNSHNGTIFTLTVPDVATTGDYLIVAGRRHAAGGDGNISFGGVQIGQGSQTGATQFNHSGSWEVTIPNVSPGQTITLTVNAWGGGSSATTRLNEVGFTISVDQVVIRANIDPYSAQRDALQTAINTAQRFVQQAYTPATWTPFNNALTAAVAGATNTAAGAGATMDGLRTALTTAQGGLARTAADPAWTTVEASDFVSSRFSTFTVVSNGIHITGRGTGADAHNNGIWLNISGMRQAYEAYGGTANAPIVVSGYMGQAGRLDTQGLTPAANASTTTAHGEFTLTIPATASSAWTNQWWGTADNPFPLLGTASGLHSDFLITGIQIGTAQITALLDAPPPPPPPTADIRTTNFRTRLNGWDVELWTQYAGGVEMAIYPSGAFTGTWTSTFNTLFRSGRSFPGRGTRIAAIGNISMRYDVAEFTSTNGATYLGIYGWARTATPGDTIVEWYIVDNWRNWIVGGGNPPETIVSHPNYTHHGTVTVNGVVYDIATAWRVQQPSIEGTTTFLQIFSVRRNSRQTANTGPFAGTIDVSAHFEAWENIGLQTHAGSGRSVHFTRDMLLTEVSFVVEGFGGNAGSSGRGEVSNLCLAYGLSYICSWGGCANCDDLVGPYVPAVPEENIIWELEITPELVEGLNAGTDAIGGVQRAAPTPIGNFGFDYSAGALVVRGRTYNWNSLDVLLTHEELTSGGEYRITVVGAGTGATQLQLSWPLDDAPWETGNVNGVGGTVSTTFTTTMPVIGGVTVTPPRIRVRTNGGTGDFTITSILIERLGDAAPPPPPPPPYCDYNSYDFQAWLANHGIGLLGGQNNHGSWPFWNTGNQNIIVEYENGNWQMAVPGAGTGGGTGYGTHGVLLRLSGPNSLNIQAGYRIEAVGYIRGTMTAVHAPPGVAFRPGHEGGSPGSNLVHVPVPTGVADQPFTISYVVTHQDFTLNAAHWSSHPALQIVRQPSQPGLYMVIQDLRIFPICNCDGVQPTGISIAPAGNFSLLTGGTRQLTATVAPADANQAVVWTSSNTSVATVSATAGTGGATVTAVAPGTATITVSSAEANTITSSVTVTVTAPGGANLPPAGGAPRPPAGGGGAIVRPAQPGATPPAAFPPAVAPPAEAPAPDISVTVVPVPGQGTAVTVQIPTNAIGNLLPIPLEEFDLAGLNTNRIVALRADGTIFGGNFDTAAGMFVLNASEAGEFTIAYAESLRRLELQTNSFAIRDLAGNAPTINMDVQPVIQDNRTLLPVRFMAYALGATVGWNDATSEVTLTLGDKSITFAIGQAAPGMDVPAQIINERTMVPLRFISEFFGAVVNWDDTTRTIEVLYM